VGTRPGGTFQGGAWPGERITIMAVSSPLNGHEAAKNIWLMLCRNLSIRYVLTKCIYIYYNDIDDKIPATQGTGEKKRRKIT